VLPCQLDKIDALRQSQCITSGKIIPRSILVGIPFVPGNVYQYKFQQVKAAGVIGLIVAAIEETESFVND
jgi:hypothetical protein